MDELIDKDNGYNLDGYMDTEDMRVWQYAELRPMIAYADTSELIKLHAKHYPGDLATNKALTLCLDIQRKALPGYFNPIACDLLTLDTLRKVVNPGLRTLDRYCDAKVQAMQCRAAGAIGLAIEFEQACDLLYKTIPDSLRSW